MSGLALLLAVATLHACQAARVRYAPDPAARGVLRSIPWVQTTNGAFTGHLFYWSATSWGRRGAHRAQIFTSRVHGRVSPKVLWVSRRGAATGRLVVRGRRLDATGSFVWRSSYVAGSEHPSYVPVPSAGCWRVTVSSGRVSGSLVFAAVDRR
jgi:hypothetical protein